MVICVLNVVNHVVVRYFKLLEKLGVLNAFHAPFVTKRWIKSNALDLDCF